MVLAGLGEKMLKHEQQFFIRFKTQTIAEHFRPDKTYAARFFGWLQKQTILQVY